MNRNIAAGSIMGGSLLVAGLVVGLLGASPGQPPNFAGIPCIQGQTCRLNQLTVSGSTSFDGGTTVGVLQFPNVSNSLCSIASGSAACLAYDNALSAPTFNANLGVNSSINAGGAQPATGAYLCNGNVTTTPCLSMTAGATISLNGYPGTDTIKDVSGAASFGGSGISLANGGFNASAGGINAPSVNFGNSTFGGMDGFFPGTVTTGTNFGNYTPASTTNLRVGSCACTNFTAGTGTAGTIIIKDVTGGTTLCTLTTTYSCVSSQVANTFNCNAAPTAGHIFSFEMTGCTTFPANVWCSCDLQH